MKAKSVNETIKFRRSDDPYSSMNIGKPTWKNIKKGDIIRCVRFTAITPRGLIIKDTRPRSLYTNYFYENRLYQLIMDPQIINKNKIYLNLGSLSEVAGHITYTDSIIGSEKQLSEIFEILSRSEYINLKESLDFERHNDPMKKMGIGIGWTRDVLYIRDRFRELSINYTEDPMIDREPFTTVGEENWNRMGLIKYNFFDEDDNPLLDENEFLYVTPNAEKWGPPGFSIQNSSAEFELDGEQVPEKFVRWIVDQIKLYYH